MQAGVWADLPFQVATRGRQTPHSVRGWVLWEGFLRKAGHHKCVCHTSTAVCVAQHTGSGTGTGAHRSSKLHSRLPSRPSRCDFWRLVQQLNKWCPTAFYCYNLMMCWIISERFHPGHWCLGAHTTLHLYEEYALSEALPFFSGPLIQVWLHLHPISSSCLIFW